jgi:hypothetical protein
MVVVGSLALVGCPDDSADPDNAPNSGGAQRVRLNPADVRTSVTSQNARVLADRDIELNKAAFLVQTGSTLASVGETVTVRITDIVDISATEARGTFVVIGLDALGNETELARGTRASGSPGSATARGVSFQGTNCRFNPDAGSVIALGTNFTTCRIAVGTQTATGGEPGVPINGAIAGILQLIVANPSSGVTFTSGSIEVTVGLNSNGNSTGSVIVDGLDTTIDVPCPVDRDGVTNTCS